MCKRVLPTNTALLPPKVGSKAKLAGKVMCKRALPTNTVLEPPIGRLQDKVRNKVLPNYNLLIKHIQLTSYKIQNPLKKLLMEIVLEQKQNFLLYI